jgi:carbon monoxide dehydrogenase subunit G
VQLENQFTVPVPIDEAWRVLLDIERVAPCMPGAALDSVEGDHFTGRVKVKLGPINLTYQGKASFVEKDEATHTAVIDAKGKDQRGNGTAAAVVTAKLAAEGDVTRVDVLTDLNITGRPAQFGRGVMTDVGNKLLGQFADKLAAQLGAGEEGLPAAAAPAAAAPAAEKAPAGEKAPTAAKAAAQVTGVAEEVAASAEQVPGNGAAAKTARKAGTAAKKAAAAATDKVTEKVTEKAAPAKAAAKPETKATAPRPTEKIAAEDLVGQEPAPAGAAAAVRPAPVRHEPEPIDLLEVAGGAALSRLAAPAAGIGIFVLIVLLVRRRRRRKAARRLAQG